MFHHFSIGVLFSASSVIFFNSVTLLWVVFFFFYFLDLLCQEWIWNKETMTHGQPCMWQLQKVTSPHMLGLPVNGAWSVFFTISPLYICAYLLFKIMYICIYIDIYKNMYTYNPAFLIGHVDVVKFLLEACKVNPFPKDRWVVLLPVWRRDAVMASLKPLWEEVLSQIRGNALSQYTEAEGTVLLF